MSEQERSSGIVNALCRLERAGAEGSKATEKLVAAAEALRQKIDTIIPDEGTCPPRGYQHKNCDGSEWIAHDRYSALRFAEAVASGWLEELAEWLEKRSAESGVATALLIQAQRSAEAKMRSVEAKLETGRR